MSKNQPFVTFDHKKTQSRADKNHSFSRRCGFRFRCRDKIEPNLQSPNVHRTHSVLVESRFQRDSENTTLQRGVKTQPRNFCRVEEIDFLTFAKAIRTELLVSRQPLPPVRKCKLRVFAVRLAVACQR